MKREARVSTHTSINARCCRASVPVLRSPNCLRDCLGVLFRVPARGETLRGTYAQERLFGLAAGALLFSVVGDAAPGEVALLSIAVGLAVDLGTKRARLFAIERRRRPRKEEPPVVLPEEGATLATSTRLETVPGDERPAGPPSGELRIAACPVLLVLLVVELISSAILHVLLPIHVFVGVLLAGPLIVKLGSTGWRFLRYYTRAPAYVRRGPPRLPLRVLAPLLVVMTLLVIGSGIGLVVTSPTQAGILLPLHNLSVLFWFSLIAIHVFAYLWRTPRLVMDDWRKPYAEQAPGRGIRLGVNLGALLVAEAVRPAHEQAVDPRQHPHVVVVLQRRVQPRGRRDVLRGLDEQQGAVELRPVRRAAQVCE